MDRDRPDFDENDSGVPVTTPDRNPDPLGPEHSVPAGLDADAVADDSSPADHARDQRAGSSQDAEGPAVPERESGLNESNPAQGA